MKNKSLISILSVSCMFLLFVFVFVASISSYYNIPVANFTGDPALINGSHPFIGILSNIGILI